VRHIDHSQQAVGDRQPEGGQQQDGAEGQPHKCLTEQIADGLTVLDLTQACGGGLTHPGIRLGLRLGIRQQPGLHFRVARFAQQRDRLLAYRWLGAGQLQAGNGEGQYLTHRLVAFACELTLQKREHLRLRVALELPGSGQPFGDTVTCQLMSGERRGGQYPQAVGKPHGFGGPLRLCGFTERS